MFAESDLRHELWEMEEEEEGDAEEEGTGAPGKAAPEGGQRWCQAAAPWGLWEDRCCCPPRLLAPCASQGGCRDCPEPPTDCSGAESSPWGRDPWPWGQPPSSWAHDIKTICRTNWATEQALWCPSRTLSHPSFQALYTAVSIRSRTGSPSAAGPVSPPESGPRPGPLPLLGCSSFFYTDPTTTPGHRIYNWLSSSSQEVFRNLPLDTPAPVMSTREATAAPRSRELSELERGTVSALLELSAGMACTPGAGRSLPGPGEVEGREDL